MTKPTNCPTCKERTFSRVVAANRVCNLCDAPKPIRARTAKAQASYDRVKALFDAFEMEAA